MARPHVHAGEAVKIEFKIHGAKELDALLKQLPGRVASRVATNSLRAGARVIRDEAKAQVPVKTGELKRSIKVITGRADRRDSRIVHVGVFGRMSGLAHIVEFGTGPRIAADADGYMTFQVNGQWVRKKQVAPSPQQPFLRPAAEIKAAAALNTIGTTLGAGIEKEALKLASGQGSGG